MKWGSRHLWRTEPLTWLVTEGVQSVHEAGSMWTHVTAALLATHLGREDINISHSGDSSQAVRHWLTRDISWPHLSGLWQCGMEEFSQGRSDRVPRHPSGLGGQDSSPGLAVRHICQVRWLYCDCVWSVKEIISCRNGPAQISFGSPRRILTSWLDGFAKLHSFKECSMQFWVELGFMSWQCDELNSIEDKC